MENGDRAGPHEGAQKVLSRYSPGPVGILESTQFVRRMPYEPRKRWQISNSLRPAPRNPESDIRG